MAPQGLRALFERHLVIDDHKVIEPIGPVWSLRWILESWQAGLDGQVREQFLNLSVREILAAADPDKRPWATSLSDRKNFELACATMIFAHKTG